MIEINLLPQEYRKKEPRFKGVDLSQLNLQSIPVMYIVVVVVGSLLVAQGGLFLLSLYGKAQVSALTKKYENIRPQKQKFDDLRAKAAATKKKISAIDELMGKRSNWAGMLNDLSESMTPGIWLVNLSYDEKVTEKLIPRTVPKNSSGGALPPVRQVSLARNLTISGYAAGAGEQGAALVGKFIKSMKDNQALSEEFSDITLGSIKSEKVEDQDVMNFKITCMFKETSK